MRCKELGREKLRKVFIFLDWVIGWIVAIFIKIGIFGGRVGSIGGKNKKFCFGFVIFECIFEWSCWLGGWVRVWSLGMRLGF